MTVSPLLTANAGLALGGVMEAQAQRLRDAAGNALEFKALADMGQLFAKLDPKAAMRVAGLRSDSGHPESSGRSFAEESE